MFENYKQKLIYLNPEAINLGINGVILSYITKSVADFGAESKASVNFNYLK